MKSPVRRAPSALPASRTIRPDHCLLAALNQLYDDAEGKAETGAGNVAASPAALPDSAGYADAAWPDLAEDVTGGEGEERLSAELRQERLAHALARANAEQARRQSDCARSCLDALLLHLDQPLAVVDRNGLITQWNAGMARLSGIAASRAVGKALSALLRLPADHVLRTALRDLAPAATYAPASRAPRVLNGPLPLLSGLTAQHITLIPLHHVPGTMEAVVILVNA